MSQFTHCISALFTACFLYAVNASAFETTPPYADSIDLMMQNYNQEGPGGVIAIVEQGDVVFAKGYGLANIEYGIPNKSNTPYQLASLSKQFTAFAIVLLEQEGKLSFESDIREYLPGLPDFGSKITVRHLLNHTSGLKDSWNLWEMSGGRHDSGVSHQQILSLTKRQLSLNFDPGSRFMYNNTGYVLLAEIVSRVSGESFGGWMSKNIFGPLGMAGTFIKDDYQKVIKGRAFSYYGFGANIKNAISNQELLGASGVTSTAVDLTRWLRNFSTGGLGGKKAIHTMQELGLLTNGETTRYALGLFVRDFYGTKLVTHGGAIAGFNTWLSYFPEYDTGVIVLGNTSEFNARSIASGVAIMALKNKIQTSARNQTRVQFPQANAVVAKGLALSAVRRLQSTVSTPRDYIGRYYSSELATEYRITFNDRVLRVEYHRGSFPLIPKGEDTFELEDTGLFDWTFTFTRNKKGKVERLILDSIRARNIGFYKQ